VFCEAVSDNFDERIQQKIFHAEIVVDNDKVAAETEYYPKNTGNTIFRKRSRRRYDEAGNRS
jgi:hypothetical protein